MKTLHNLVIVSAVIIGAGGAAQAANISNSSLPVVGTNTPDQQNVSPDRGMNRPFFKPRPHDSRSNYPTAEDYPQGQNPEQTISNSSIGVVDSTTGQIDVINSMIGAVRPEAAAQVNLINSSVGAVQSNAAPEVNKSNSNLGAIESIPTNQNPFQGGTQAAIQGNLFGPPGAGMSSGGSSSNPTNYPASDDYGLRAFAGTQATGSAGLAATAVPEPSSGLAMLFASVGAGLMLKRKKRQKAANGFPTTTSSSLPRATLPY